LECSSTIDHIWSTPDLALYKGQPDLPGSDHRPQLCYIRSNISRPPSKLIRSWKGINEKEVLGLAKVRLSSPRFQPSEDLDLFTNSLLSTLQEIANEVAPEKPVKLGKKTVWWHQKLSTLHSDLKSAYKE